MENSEPLEVTVVPLGTRAFLADSELSGRGLAQVVGYHVLVCRENDPPSLW